MIEEDVVMVMGDDPTMDRDLLGALRDDATGEYRTILPPDNEKEQIKNKYLLLNPNASADAFEAAWPRIWTLDMPHSEDAPLFAMIDSGVMLEHPLLKECIRETVDFTGEGAEDECGHGSMMALIYRIREPGIPRNRYIILKAVGADGRGNPDNLIAAMDWITEYNKTHRPQIGVANLSLGVYSKKLALFECKGDCKVCKAAERAATEGNCMIVAAAGNTAGRTACPAKVALYKEVGVLAVEDPNYANSGIGSIGVIAPPRYEVTPTDPSE